MKVILKISGEALKSGEKNVSQDKLKDVLNIVRIMKEDSHRIAIVVGGGNYFRGREHPEMGKVNGDTIGMLSTVVNAIYIKDYLENNGYNSIISTPFDFPNLVPNYSNDELKELFKDNIIVFGGGVGMSGYSTDSGTTLAAEIVDADLIIKLTNVDGVYDSDPDENPNAHMFTELSYQEVLDKELGVMDLYAIKKCMENKTKILVMNFNDYNKIPKFFEGKRIGTLIGD